MVNEIEQEIIGKRLTDIYSVGFIDTENNVGQYYPDYRWIYIELDKNTIIEMESCEQFSRLKVQKVEDVRYLFEVDEDMIKAKSSIQEIVLVTSMLKGNKVKEFILIEPEQVDHVCFCGAVKIILENGQVVFLDPTFIYGIGIGGVYQEKYWKYCKV